MVIVERRDLRGAERCSSAAFSVPCIQRVRDSGAIWRLLLETIRLVRRSDDRKPASGACVENDDCEGVELNERNVGDISSTWRGAQAIDVRFRAYIDNRFRKAGDSGFASGVHSSYSSGRDMNIEWRRLPSSA